MLYKLLIISVAYFAFCKISLASEILYKQELKHPDNKGRVALEDMEIKSPDISSYIPTSFGKLVQIEKGSAGYDKYLWFEAKDGTIRMVRVIYQTDNYISISNKVDVFKRK